MFALLERLCQRVPQPELNRLLVVLSILALKLALNAIKADHVQVLAPVHAAQADDQADLDRDDEKVEDQVALR